MTTTQIQSVAVTHEEKEIIIQIIKKHIREEGALVLVFGSRYKGTHRPSSDLDLAIKSKTPLGLFTLDSIKYDFMESDIIYSIDILDYTKISDNFKKIIDKGHDTWQIT